MKHSDIQSLLDREITREEFLKYIGIALISAIGITTFLRNLNQLIPAKQSALKSSRGYGHSPYGR